MASFTGHSLNIIGKSNVCLSFDGLPHEKAVLVASDLSYDSMLVAWHDLQPLEVISPNFPARISATVSKELTTDIMKEFPALCRDKFCELPMNVPKMKIVLAENAVPFKVSTSRQVPLRLQKTADKTVFSKVLTRFQTIPPLFYQSTYRIDIQADSLDPQI